MKYHNNYFKILIYFKHYLDYTSLHNMMKIHYKASNFKKIINLFYQIFNKFKYY